MGHQQIDDISDSQTFVNANENMQEETTSHLLQTPEILLKYSMPTKEKKKKLIYTLLFKSLRSIRFFKFHFNTARTLN